MSLAKRHKTENRERQRERERERQREKEGERRSKSIWLVSWKDTGAYIADQQVRA